MSAITIPAGKTVRIFENGRSIFDKEIDGIQLLDVPMIIDEQVTFNLSSSFEPLFNLNATKNPVLKALAKQLSATTGANIPTDFKELGFQQYTGTDPLSLNLTVKFFRGNADIYESGREVYLPTLVLASIPLPTVNEDGSSLSVPGPDFFSGTSEEQTGDKGRFFSLEIGNYLRLRSIIIKKAEPTFSTELDEFGYPISSTVNLDITSTFTATTNLILDAFIGR